MEFTLFLSKFTLNDVRSIKYPQKRRPAALKKLETDPTVPK
jgi:hypothetical protein